MTAVWVDLFYKNNSDSNAMNIIIITIILFVIFYFIVIPITGWLILVDDKKHIRILYAVIILLMSIFIILFICYNNKSIEVYEESLEEIKGMYYTNYQNDTNSIISNYNVINNRILFLQERIAHYQNDANHFASLWLTLLSLLFVIITGFNLFNLNEKQKELDRLIEQWKLFRIMTTTAQTDEDSSKIKGLSDGGSQ